jgi:hypothetical protein
MIKVSCSIHVQIYTDIFNVILKSGIYPSLWRENFIKPLFKGGCSNDPSCYRGVEIWKKNSRFARQKKKNILTRVVGKKNSERSKKP